MRQKKRNRVFAQKKELQTIITTPRTTAHNQSELTGYGLKIG
jgi:hypothetical protein